MKQVGMPISAALLAALLCIPCALPLIGVPETGQRQEEVWRCSPLPAAFQESDLVGTWQARYFPRAVTDTLVLREDGTYQQVYEDDLADYYYTSPWNQWYVEYRPSGGFHLHLVGMHYCLGTDEICRRESGGGGSHPYYDFCEDRTIWNMGNEIILAVTGREEGIPDTESPLQGMLLRHMRFNPEGTDSFFVLQE